MPTVLRIGKYRFHFYSNENSKPPHIHVTLKGGGVCKFWIDQEVILAKNQGVSAQELTIVRNLVIENQEQLKKIME